MTCGSNKTEVCVAANCATGSVVPKTEGKKTTDPVAPKTEENKEPLAPVMAPVTATDPNAEESKVAPTKPPAPILIVDPKVGQKLKHIFNFKAMP